MPYKLLGVTTDHTIEIPDGKTILVGRAVTSDLAVYDPTVSRKHAQLTATGGSLVVKDLGSSNGTFVNGNRIAEATVSSGDSITFGKIEFSLNELVPKPSPPPPAAFPGRPPEPAATIVRKIETPSSGELESVGKMEPPAGGTSMLKVQAETDEERREKKLHLLLDISKELARMQDVDKLLEKIADITFQVMAVDRVSIQMVDGDDLTPRISKNKLGGAGGKGNVPRSIANRAVQEKLAILTDNAAADDRFQGKSILMQSVRSAMCTPLMGSTGTVLGIIYVDNLTATNSFDDEDLEFLIAFSGIAAVAIENSQLTETVRKEAIIRSNFARYFAPDLAEEIANKGEAVGLGGEKRPVVVFFTDIRGFTAMSENMKPDEIANLLTEYFTEMVAIVFKHGGTLDKFMGDAIMALWGAPLAKEGDLDRSMAAAIEMLDVLDVLNESWAKEDRPTIHIGIGINYGEVFAGNIGSEQRMEYTVIGDSVNVASRLCSKAMGGEIIVSHPFYEALENPPEVEELEPMALKGKSEVVPVYRVKR